jgi:hypothetical protein
MVLTDTTVGVSVGPLEGFGSFVVALDIAGDFASEVSSGSKDAAGQQIASVVSTMAQQPLKPPPARESRQGADSEAACRGRAPTHPLRSRLRRRPHRHHSGVIDAVDAVLDGRAKNAFCAADKASANRRQGSRSSLQSSDRRPYRKAYTLCRALETALACL